MWKARGTRQLPRFVGHQPLSFSLYHFGVKSQSHLLQRRTPAPYWSSQSAVLLVKDAVALSQRDCAELRPRPLLSNWAGARGVRGWGRWSAIIGYLKKGLQGAGQGEPYNAASDWSRSVEGVCSASGKEVRRVCASRAAPAREGPEYGSPVTCGRLLTLRGWKWRCKAPGVPKSLIFKINHISMQ